MTVVGATLGIGAYLIGNLLLGIYTVDAPSNKLRIKRLSVVSAFYYLCGWMDVLVGSLRGNGVFDFTDGGIFDRGVCV